MWALLLVLSVLWIALGTMMVLYTDQVRKSIKGIFAAADIRLVAILPLVMGLLLAVGAFMVKEVFWLALILGLLGIAKGAYLALGPLSQIRQLWDWWFDHASETAVRLSGLITFMIGVAMLSWLL
jgi:energy-converting hydrogenase Eha subunit H